MNREIHVRFWEGLGVRFHRATQLAADWWRSSTCQTARARAQPTQMIATGRRNRLECSSRFRDSL